MLDTLIQDRLNKMTQDEYLTIGKLTIHKVEMGWTISEGGGCRLCHTSIVASKVIKSWNARIANREISSHLR